MGIFTSNKPVPQQYYIKEKLLKCHNCGKDHFHKRRSVLPMQPARLEDWANRYTVCYECTECNFIHWFAEEGKD